MVAVFVCAKGPKVAELTRTQQHQGVAVSLPRTAGYRSNPDLDTDSK